VFADFFCALTKRVTTIWDTCQQDFWTVQDSGQAARLDDPWFSCRELNRTT
jgi:hypothetical protein